MTPLRGTTGLTCRWPQEMPFQHSLAARQNSALGFIAEVGNVGRPNILEVAMARHQSGEPGLRVGSRGSAMLLEYVGKGLPNLRCHARGLATDEDHRLLPEQAPHVLAVVFDRLLHVGLRLAGLAREGREQPGAPAASNAPISFS